MVDKRGTQKLIVIIYLVTPQSKTPLGRIHVDRKMTRGKGMTRYQLMSFLHELVLFFISSFLCFPSHIKRIILCFVYSDEHQPSFIYPSLLEENLQHACVVKVGPETSFQPIENNEVYISIPPENTQPCDHENDEIDSKPSRISLSSVIIEPFHQLVNPHVHPTAFQTRIKMKMFKPLRLPYHLHPYPLNFFEYLPHFSGEDHIVAEKNLGAFENFVDQFEIVYEDVTMRLFSKSLFGDVDLWFKGLGADSIGSWIELYNAFLRHWGENKSFDQHLTDFCAHNRKEDEALATFNKRFHSFYYNMPIEIRPTEVVAMVQYTMAQHPNLFLYLRERKSPSLQQMFVDA
jgi:hypothetical protein